MKVNQDQFNSRQETQLELRSKEDYNVDKSNIIGAIKTIPKWCELGNSVLNGIVGDYLEQQENELKIEMGFYHNNKPVKLESNTLKEIYPDITPKICILVHGLCANEYEWELCGSGEIDYGKRLKKDLGYTPLYLRYNSGLHVSENGKNLSNIINNLVNNYPVRIDEIIFICHSMGGLVTRSACNYGIEYEHAWTKKVKRFFYLASPHLGSPFERFGNVLTYILKAISNPITQLIGDIINLRSSAIKDLRYGYVIDKDWQGHDPNALLEDNRNNIPLLKNASHYNIASSLTEDPEHPLNKYVGDPLVTLSSAFGKSKIMEKSIPFSKNNNIVFTKKGHLEVANNDDVYKQILLWCKHKPNE
ncbi:permease [Candidatus Magnetomorum sp. HK-1]|nr:permease [Candidatus Magnetomorum sp. HK-1]